VPEGEGVVAIATDNVEDALGDGGEDPVDDAGVHHAPLAVALVVGSHRANMALEAEFAESRVEEVAPLAEVALVEIEDDRDMVANGEGLDLRRDSGYDVRAIVGVMGAEEEAKGLESTGQRSLIMYEYIYSVQQMANGHSSTCASGRAA